MNPLHWTGEQQFAWIASSAIGAVIGLLIGFTHTPLFSRSQTLKAFVTWLSLPELYWQWPTFGFVLTGTIFYAVQYLRSED